MKAKPEKMALTFGEFILAVYDAWGKRRARGIIRLVVEARLIEFQRKGVSDAGPTETQSKPGR